LFFWISDVLTYCEQDTFEKRYHAFQVHKAEVHYPDTDAPQIEMVFRKGREQIPITRKLADLPILKQGIAYEYNGEVKVEVQLQFHQWVFDVDVPLICLKGRPDFSPAGILQ
jgi:hypothetical protein